MKNQPLTDIEYYLHQVAREGWLGSRSVFVCRRIITEHKKVLKPRFIGIGKATRITILGADILNFQKYAK